MNKHIKVITGTSHIQLVIDGVRLTIKNITLYGILEKAPDINIIINQLPENDGTLPTKGFYDEMIRALKGVNNGNV